MRWYHSNHHSRTHSITFAGIFSVSHIVYNLPLYVVSQHPADPALERRINDDREALISLLFLCTIGISSSYSITIRNIGRGLLLPMTSSPIVD